MCHALAMRLATESFYGSPRQLFLIEITGFEISSRPYLLKIRYPLPLRCQRSIVLRKQDNT